MAARLRAALRALAWSLAPLAALVVLLEIGLRVAGLGDSEARARFARGFDRSARYLVPDDDVPGAWRTQMFDGAGAELVIPPRDERTRVLLFGGSNTAAFPEQLLAEELAERRPEPGWEVVNLGRPGYGSERVSILFEQAMALEPDLVLIYSGHNEFIERGFAMELAEAWSAPAAGLAKALQHLRTVNVLTDLLADAARVEERRAPVDEAAAGEDGAVRDGAGLADGNHRPEAHAAARETFWDLSYDQTLLFYDVYRDNLDAMCRTARAHGVRVLLCTVVGNMLSQPAVTADPRDRLDDATRRRHTYLVDRALRRMPPRAVGSLLRLPGGGPPARPRWNDWGQVIRGAAGRPGPEHEGRPPPPPLRPLGPPFDGGPYWADPSGWTDDVHALVRSLAALHARRLSPDERQALREARGLLEEVVVLMPDDALSTYALGLCRYLLGDDAEAVSLLREASRRDLGPNRGNDLSNDVVRALAAARPEVRLFDAEELAAAASPSRLIGYELMVDNCHLHIGALPVLMEQFAGGLLELTR